MERIFKKELIFDLALLLNRIIFGIFIVFGHGWGKLERIIEGDFQFSEVFGLPSWLNLILVVFAEVVCGIALLLGFQTRWASALLILTMFVAGFIVHGSHPFFMTNAEGGGSKELAILFMAGFIISFLLGGGKFSLDYTILKKRR